MPFFVIMALDIMLLSTRIWPAACNKDVTLDKPHLNSLIFFNDPDEQRKDAEERTRGHTTIKTVLSSVENGIHLTVHIDQGRSSHQSKREYPIIPKNNNESTSGILPHLTSGKQQLLRQNGKVIDSNNHLLMNGLSNQIVGSTPQSAVDMVQRYVEDIIRRPNGERPGYIMINSQNPLIINQLTELLQNRYGSSSVINEPAAVQDFLGSKPDIKSTSTSSSSDTNSIPVFPFQSHFLGNSALFQDSHAATSEADFIKQQLSSIANISISSGKLINDTTDSLQSITLKSTQDIPVFNITALKKPSISLMEEQETALTNSSTVLLNEIQHPTQANNLTKIEETSTEVEPADNMAYNITGLSENNSNDTLISIPQSIHVHPNGIPIEIPGKIQLIGSATEISTEIFSETTESILQTIPDQSTLQFLFPKKNDSVQSSTIHTSTTDNKDVINQSLQNPYSHELQHYLDFSTTGYEDYYEEIDGELVLSPTKFMRKSGPGTSIDYGNYEYYENGYNDRTDSSTKIIIHQGNQTYQDQYLVNETQHQSIDVHEDVQFNIFSYLNKEEHSLSSNNYVQHINTSITDKMFHNSDHESHTDTQENESISNPNNRLHNSFYHKGVSAVESPTDVQYVQQNKIMQAMELETTQLGNIKDTSDHPIRVPVFKLNTGALDAHPIKFPNHQHVQFETPLAFVSPEIRNNLKNLSNNDLQTLEILNEMGTIIKSSSISENKTSLTLLPGYSYTEDKNSREDLLINASKLPIVIEKQPNVTTLDHNSNSITVRTNFSAGNFRQSDNSRQQVPPGFFPQRPTSEVQHSTPHQGISNEQASHQLTADQEQIISRLPVGMQHVVSSIVQALQAPSSTTTLPPVQYPYVYPYPYPYLPHNFFPPTNPFHPSQAQPTSLPSNHLAHNTHANHHNEIHGNTNLHQHRHENHEHHHGHHVHHSQESHNHQETNLVTESPSQTSGSQGTPSYVTTDIPQKNRINEGPDIVPSQNNHDNRQNFYAAAGAQVAWTNNPIFFTNITPTVSPNLSTTKDNISQAGSLHLISSLRPGLTPPISQSRTGVLDESVLDQLKDKDIALSYAEVASGNPNQLPTIGQTCSNSGSTGGSCESRLHSQGTPPRPDRNQGLLEINQDPSHMGNGDLSNSGIIKYRPPQASNMQMGSPVHNVVLTENATPLPQVEPIPLDRTNPSQDSTLAATTQAPGAMNRQEMNSVLHSLFSSPTLLLLGIVFATSAAYMAIAMEEQAAQQRFQQAQLAAAFSRQPFPQGRKRRNTRPVFYE